MSRWLKLNNKIMSVLDALTLAVLGIALLFGKIKGAPQNLLTIECGIATLVVSILLLLVDLGLIANRWAKYGWWLLVLTLCVFAIANR